MKTGTIISRIVISLGTDLVPLKIIQEKCYHPFYLLNSVKNKTNTNKTRNYIKKHATEELLWWWNFTSLLDFLQTEGEDFWVQLRLFFVSENQFVELSSPYQGNADARKKKKKEYTGSANFFTSFTKSFEIHCILMQFTHAISNSNKPEFCIWDFSSNLTLKQSKCEET